MESKNLLTLAITLTVGIILAGSLLMPVLSDTTTTEKTFVNEGVFNYGIFSPDDSYTLVYDQATGTLTANDEVVTPITGISLTQYGSYSVISSDNVLLRYGTNTNGYFMQIIGNDSGGNNVLGGGSCTATISNGKIEVSYESGGNPITKTFDFTEMYGIVKNTDKAILKASASTVYIKGDSELYASGVTTVSAWNNVFHFEGTYDDDITISSPNLPDATYSNIKWNIEAVDGYIDLYKLTSIEFDITYNDTTVHATYSYFGVPEKVTAELSQHLDAGEIALLNALPVIVIIGLVLAGVGVIFVRNRD